MDRADLRCIKVETTIGTFDITSLQDVENLLKMNKRILIVGERTNDLSTVLKWFGVDSGILRYAAMGAQIIRSTLPHPVSYHITDNILQWSPCPCPHKTCPTHGIKSGWVEDVRKIYEVLGETNSTPSPEEIQ